MNLISNNTRSRALLKAMRNKAKSMGLPTSAVRSHRLLLYAKLLDDNSSVDFALDRRTGQTPLEIRLDENDAYIAYSMGLLLHKVPIVGGDELPAVSYRIAYPDPTIFPGPAINGVTEQQSLEMLYNGKLQIDTEQDIRLKEFDTSIFRTVPRTQASGGVLPQCDGSEMKDLVSGLVFTGGTRNDIKVQLNSKGGNYSAIAGVTDDHVNYAVLALDGLIITGGSKPVAAGRLNMMMRS